MPCQPPPPFCHSGPFALLPGKSHEASPRDHGPCLSPALTPAAPVTSWFSKLPWVLCTPRSLLFLPPGVLSFRTSLGLASHPSCLCAPVLSWQGSFLTPSSLSVTQSCWEGLRRGSQGSVLSSSVPHTGLCVGVCVCVCVCGHLLPLKAGTLPVWFSAGASAPRGATLLSGPPRNFGESA